MLMLAGPAAGTARAGDREAQLARIDAMQRDGNAEEALRLAEALLSADPQSPVLLLTVARLYQALGRTDAALPLGRTLVGLAPGEPSVWELMVQLHQASGELDRRDEALRELITAQRNSLDPALRLRPFIIRDLIHTPNRTIVVRENFDTGSGDEIRLAFVPVSEAEKPRNLLVLRADSALAQTWRNAGILAAGKRLFTLVSLYREGRRSRQAVYEIYPDLPAYDQVRAKVLDILKGAAKPLSGKAGGLAVPPR